jgi:hypothetical protein
MSSMSLALCVCISGRFLYALQGTRRIEHRCRGCGRAAKSAQADVEAQTLRPAIKSPGAAVTLCAECRRLVDNLRQDVRIAAFFAFSRGRKRKYYAAFRVPTSN